jgi:hypothetical protein
MERMGESPQKSFFVIGPLCRGEANVVLPT